MLCDYYFFFFFCYKKNVTFIFFFFFKQKRAYEIDMGLEFRRVLFRSKKAPPPGPLVPTKSVSQKVQTAVARSASRPLQRLQPAKRQNTAARPVWPPSPCSVL